MYNIIDVLWCIYLFSVNWKLAREKIAIFLDKEIQIFNEKAQNCSSPQFPTHSRGRCNWQDRYSKVISFISSFEWWHTNNDTFVHCRCTIWNLRFKWVHLACTLINFTFFMHILSNVFFAKNEEVSMEIGVDVSIAFGVDVGYSICY